MTIKPDDQRLTAYALGELEEEQSAQLEALLKENPSIAAEVAAIREAATLLESELTAASTLELSEEQRSRVITGGDEPGQKIITPGPDAFSRTSRWLGITAAAACVMAVSTIGIKQFLLEEKQAVAESLAHDQFAAEKTAESKAVKALPVTIDSRVVDLALNAVADESKLSLRKEMTEGLADVLPEIAHPATPGETRVFRQQVAKSKPRPTMAAANAIKAVSEDNGLEGIESSRGAATGFLGGQFNQGEGQGRARQNAQQAKLKTAAAVGHANRALKENLGLEANDFGDDALEGKKEFEQLDKRADAGGERFGRLYDTPFFQAFDRPLSTFAVDVDTASYANMRRYIGRHGQLPPTDAVRVEELINYFDYDYPQPEDSRHPFSVNLEVAACPWEKGHRLVRVGLKAREMNPGKRPASNLIFLIDASGSMNRPLKLPLLKSSLAALTRNLTEDDRIGIVIYAGNAGVALDPVHGDLKEKIIDVIDGIGVGGGTNGAGGIRVAYDLAAKNYIKGGTNRVILATDGDFNVGITDSGELAKFVKDRSEKDGIFLTALGFGEGNINDERLEQIANKGNGEYYYIDSAKEGRRVLVDKLSSTLVNVAKDVKIQVDFNPAKVESYRLIGYANRRMKAQDFRDDKKDAGEIGAGHTVTALYQIVPAGAKGRDGAVATAKPESRYRKAPEAEARKAALVDSDELLTVALRYKAPDAGLEDEATEFAVGLRDSMKGWEDSSQDFRFAASVAGFGMQLRESEFRGMLDYDLLLELAGEGVGEDKNGLRKEFMELVKKARKITK
jgi:Ca-activated chloride channel family protein